MTAYGGMVLAIMRGAEPFLLPGGSRGVLLIHGFTGSPAEMKLLGQYLSASGYTVLAPRLCGHGSRVHDMAPTTWPYWYAAVEDGYHLLQGLCDDIAVVGLSMGGLLALKLAVEQPVRKVAALSAPIYLYDRRLPLLPLYRLFRNYAPHKRKAFPDIEPCYSVGYDRTPLASLSSLLTFIDHVRKLLPLLDVPAFIAQSKVEHTVRPESAEYIYQHVGSKDKELFWLEKSGHIITLDAERQTLFAAISRFLSSKGEA